MWGCLEFHLPVVNRGQKVFDSCGQMVAWKTLLWCRMTASAVYKLQYTQNNSSHTMHFPFPSKIPFSWSAPLLLETRKWDSEILSFLIIPHADMLNLNLTFVYLATDLALLFWQSPKECCQKALNLFKSWLSLSMCLYVQVAVSIFQFSSPVTYHLKLFFWLNCIQSLIWSVWLRKDIF